MTSGRGRDTQTDLYGNGEGIKRFFLPEHGKIPVRAVAV